MKDFVGKMKNGSFAGWIEDFEEGYWHLSNFVYN
jgi:hypothetical protein